MRKGIIIFWVVLGLLLPSVSVKAQKGKIRIGNLKIVPGLTVEEVYDDNIYSGNGTNTNNELEESDWITHMKPSLVFNYALDKRGSLSLGYQGDLAYYGETEENNWQTHKGAFKFDYTAPGGVIIGINNTYSDAEDPYGAANEYGLGQLTERWNNDLSTKLGYNFGNRLKVFLFYNFYKQDYDLEGDYSQDYDSHEFGTGFELKLLPKTWGFIRYHYGEQDYFTHGAGSGSDETNDSDYDWQRVNAGLTWESGAKIGGELNFGYQWKDYDNATDADGDLYEDKDTWIAATSLNYDATSTTKLLLNISRELKESGSDTNEYYENTSLGMTLKQEILRKFTLSAGFTYSYSDYNLPVINPREDDNYSGSLDFEYEIQDWLSAGIGYDYSRKDSNDIANDYTVNQYMISLKAEY